jgi:hypothetical protein
MGGIKNMEENKNIVVIKDDNITFSELFSVLWNAKVLIILVSVIMFIVTFLGVKFYNNNNTKVVTFVSMQWDGISEGEYPDGQLFNYMAMFNSNILAETLNETGLSDISVSKLRENIEIEGIVPDDAKALIEQRLRAGEDVNYYPSEFKLSLNVSELNINTQKARQLYNNLVTNFKVDFEQKYVQRTILVSLEDTDLSVYDYADIYDLLKSETTLIKNSINQKLPEGSKFISTTNHLGFQDLLIRVNRLEQTLMKDLIASIETKDRIVSKNPTLTKTRYENQIETLELELQRLTSIKVELTTLITNYNGGEHVIIIPGMTPDNSYKIDPYLNDLYEMIVENEYKIAEVNKEIALYESRIVKLSATGAENVANDEHITSINHKVDQITNGIEDLISKTNIVLEDYNKVTVKNTVRELGVASVEMPQNTMMLSLIGLVAGAGLGSVAAFTSYYYKKYKNKTNTVSH